MGAQKEKVTAWECIPFAFDVNNIAVTDLGYGGCYELRVGRCALPLDHTTQKAAYLWSHAVCLFVLYLSNIIDLKRCVLTVLFLIFIM